MALSVTYTNFRAPGAPIEKRKAFSLKILILLASAAALATAADNTSLSGKWQVHSSIAGNDNDQACTFTQKDNDLSGTCSSDKGAVNITGKIDGKKVNW